MYKLKKHDKTVMIGPLRECMRHLNQLYCRGVTLESVLKDGWLIEPARRGRVTVALLAISEQ